MTPGGLYRARRGVIVGSGGFEHNAAMRAQYQRQPIGTEWTVGAKENTGDGIRAGQRLGADVALMDDAWWGPAIPLPGDPYFCLAERTLPGGLIVNAVEAGGSSTRPPPTATWSTPCTTGTRPTPTSRPG